MLPAEFGLSLLTIPSPGTSQLPFGDSRGSSAAARGASEAGGGTTGMGADSRVAIRGARSLEGAGEVETTDGSGLSCFASTGAGATSNSTTSGAEVDR